MHHNTGVTIAPGSPCTIIQGYYSTRSPYTIADHKLFPRFSQGMGWPPVHWIHWRCQAIHFIWWDLHSRLLCGEQYKWTASRCLQLWELYETVWPCKAGNVYTISHVTWTCFYRGRRNPRHREGQSSEGMANSTKYIRSTPVLGASILLSPVHSTFFWCGNYSCQYYYNTLQATPVQSFTSSRVFNIASTSIFTQLFPQTIADGSIGCGFIQLYRTHYCMFPFK